MFQLIGHDNSFMPLSQQTTLAGVSGESKRRGWSLCGRKALRLEKKFFSSNKHFKASVYRCSSRVSARFSLRRSRRIFISYCGFLFMYNKRQIKYFHCSINWRQTLCILEMENLEEQLVVIAHQSCVAKLLRKFHNLNNQQTMLMSSPSTIFMPEWKFVNFFFLSSGAIKSINFCSMKSCFCLRLIRHPLRSTCAPFNDVVNFSRVNFFIYNNTLIAFVFA